MCVCTYILYTCSVCGCVYVDVCVSHHMSPLGPCVCVCVCVVYVCGCVCMYVDVCVCVCVCVVSCAPHVAARCVRVCVCVVLYVGRCVYVCVCVCMCVYVCSAWGYCAKGLRRKLSYNF